jgi:hypothetical protein
MCHIHYINSLRYNLNSSTIDVVKPSTSRRFMHASQKLPGCIHQRLPYTIWLCLEESSFYASLKIRSALHVVANGRYFSFPSTARPFHIFPHMQSLVEIGNKYVVAQFCTCMEPLDIDWLPNSLMCIDYEIISTLSRGRLGYNQLAVNSRFHASSIVWQKG